MPAIELSLKHRIAFSFQILKHFATEHERKID
jgi:hypothetical protein